MIMQITHNSQEEYRSSPILFTIFRQKSDMAVILGELALFSSSAKSKCNGDGGIQSTPGLVKMGLLERDDAPLPRCCYAVASRVGALSGGGAGG